MISVEYGLLPLCIRLAQMGTLEAPFGCESNTILASREPCSCLPLVVPASCPTRFQGAFGLVFSNQDLL